MEYAQGDGFGPEGDDVVDCGDSFISLEDMTVAPFGKEPVEKSLHSLSSPLRSSIFPKYHITLIGSSARVPVNFTLQSSAGPVERCDVLW
mmetsp:Transcript_5187/g.10001  ORF Transcript_5187/g.10001 Transcript_5187/m.10001 type:complete len:90 (-) Transcript_5187:58-327(-)